MRNPTITHVNTVSTIYLATNEFLTVFLQHAGKETQQIELRVDEDGTFRVYLDTQEVKVAHWEEWSSHPNE